MMPDGAIGLPLLSGMLTLGLIIGNQRISAGFALAVGYALGMGILGQLMLVMGWRDLALSKDTIAGALLIYSAVICILIFFRRRYFPSKKIDLMNDRNEAWTGAQQLMAVLMSAYVLYQMVFIFWNAYYVPVFQADSFSVHAYKAKIFFYTHHLKQPSEAYLTGKYLTYPLQVSLAMAWLAFNIGQWHEGWVKMIFPVNCVAFCVIVYHCLKAWTDRLTALLAITLLVSSLFFVLHASIAYADFTVMFYAMSAMLLMAYGLNKRRVAFIILGGLMAAFAVSVKFEGTVYALLGGIILCRFIFAKEFFDTKFALKAIAAYFLPIIGTEINLHIYKFHYGIVESLNHEHDPAFFHQGAYILSMSRVFADNFFLSGNWNILWPLLIIMYWANGKDQKTFMIKFFSFALSIFLGFFLLAVPLTNLFAYHANTSSIGTVSRLILHFYPLCPLLIALLVHQLLKNRRHQVAAR